MCFLTRKTKHPDSKYSAKKLGNLFEVIQINFCNTCQLHNLKTIVLKKQKNEKKGDKFKKKNTFNILPKPWCTALHNNDVCE